MIYYCVRDYGTDFFLCKEANELNWIGAQVCADNFYTCHDGWESEWPLEIGLSENPNGPASKWFEVSLEMTPDFSAEEIYSEEVET